MADARALLRAHRAENRIKHPHAAYSDAGKLLCKLCHEAVKTEALWDSHIRGQSHRQRLQALQQQQQQTEENTQKRKRGSDDGVDETMSDADQDAPKKRSRVEETVTMASTIGKEKEKDRTLTPPLARRTSGTPGQGIEIAIPSRPATPLASSNSAVSTPKITSTIARSPLVGSEGNSNSGASSAHQSVTSRPISTERLGVPAQIPAATATSSKPANAPSSTTAPIAGSSGAVDEAEWAAFEAEMEAEGASADAAPSRVNGNSNGSIYADATISAPALTAAEVEAKSQEEENERRRHAADTQIADEREDAERALEAEFEEMEELEGRVRKLKERREELRKESLLNLRGAASASAASAVAKAAGGKENSAALDEEDEDDDDDDDDDDDEDDFDGFRFRV